MSKFRDKVVVITGAGSGIGRALALNLAKKGAKLAISDIDMEGLAETERLATELGATVRADRLNVAERESVLIYADMIKNHFGKVNQIYNNAGIAYHGDVIDMSFKDIDRIMDVDFWGVVHGTKAFLPYLIESGDGHVVNVSSLFGLLSMPGQSAYNAAKFAVRGFTESLREEMLIAKLPVKVSCVHPGGIKTNIVNNAEFSEKENGSNIADLFNKKLALHTAESAAKTIVDGVADGDARILIGFEATSLDILARLTGSGYQRLIAIGAGFMMPKKG